MFGIAMRYFVVPQFNCFAPGARRHSAAVVKLNGWLNADSEYRAGMKFGYKRLIEPSACQIDPERNGAFSPQHGS